MKSVFGILTLTACTSAFAMIGFLQSQSTNGSLRYCKYSNGVVITINVMEFCPMTVN